MLSMTKVYLGLGSNVGDREQQLNEALRLLDAQPGIQVTQVSSLLKQRQSAMSTSLIFKFMRRN